jgi:hypothetical protein
MTSRKMNMFHTLLEYLRVCDDEVYRYYLSELCDSRGELYPELVTQSVIMEMQCSVFNAKECVIPD